MPSDQLTGVLHTVAKFPSPKPRLKSNPIFLLQLLPFWRLINKL